MLLGWQQLPLSPTPQKTPFFHQSLPPATKQRYRPPLQNPARSLTTGTTQKRRSSADQRSYSQKDNDDRSGEHRHCNQHNGTLVAVESRDKCCTSSAPAMRLDDKVTGPESRSKIVCSTLSVAALGWRYPVASSSTPSKCIIRTSGCLGRIPGSVQHVMRSEEIVLNKKKAAAIGNTGDTSFHKNGAQTEKKKMLGTATHTHVQMLYFKSSRGPHMHRPPQKKRCLPFRGVAAQMRKTGWP
mmetsp:Transcript_23819/g.54163  ORF Transcript_23819/g.54163 Transcript_23819/m.54163 type:complete len:241 (-) Transcript_23819:3317-4039(-)